jgi:hypothetical protein
MFKIIKRKNTYKNTLSISKIFPEMNEHIPNEFFFTYETT